MIKITDPKRCCGCSACETICPKHCISMIPDAQGFEYPQVNLDLCIDCHLCERTCPELQIERSDKIIGAYAFTNNDNDVLLTSSSGGFFYKLAEHVLNSGGVVFGASFDENFNVKHIKISQCSDISKLQGSKYVQSNLHGIYREISHSLKQGKLVLFTGTPCQIAGLESFLNRSYDNLIKLSIACHGVPSEKIWQLWLKGKFKGKYDTISSINFRFKNPSWENYSMRVEFQNNKYCIIPGNKNSFMKAYLDNLLMRPSCTSCQFKINSTADITMADFWGIMAVDPKLYNKNGVSLIVSHSAKGQEILGLLGLTNNVVDYNEALKYNHSLVDSTILNADSQGFYAVEDSKKYSYIERKYNKSIFERIIRRILHK